MFAVTVLSSVHDHVQLIAAHAHHHLLADPSSAPGSGTVGGTGDTSKLQSWLKKNILTSVLMLIGLVFLLKANVGKHAEVIKAAGVSVIALMFIGLAAKNDPAAVGTWALGLVGI
jgi:hypothetical protein